MYFEYDFCNVLRINKIPDPLHVYAPAQKLKGTHIIFFGVPTIKHVLDITQKYDDVVKLTC